MNKKKIYKYGYDIHDVNNNKKYITRQLIILK